MAGGSEECVRESDAHSGAGDEQDGLVFDIQRFCVHDGPGIRTSVFLKGCPLRCRWCHNPESWLKVPEILFSPELCIGCGACEAAGWPCPSGRPRDALRGREGRRLCSSCMRCTQVCPSHAIEACGRRMSVSEVLGSVLSDRVFYEESGGGMTLSGGEPMLQFEFSRTLLEQARKAGVHCCMETCGCAPGEQYLEIAPLVDLFLWDLKDTNPERHVHNTGVALEPIVENLHRLDAAGARTLLRCVLVGGVNCTAEHYETVARIGASLRHCMGVELLPYHPLGQSKRTRLGLGEDAAPFAAPGGEELCKAAASLERCGVPVRLVHGG